MCAIENVELFVFLAVGLVMFIGSIVMRSKSGGKYEVKPIDLFIITVPLLLWMLATGRIQKFGFGDFGFETAEALISASEKSIEDDLSYSQPSGISDVVEVMETATKEGVERIPRLIQNKTEVLTFNLLGGGYWGPAIQEYFESLFAAQNLKYAVIQRPDGSMFGLFDANRLMEYFRKNGQRSYEQFAQYLNYGDGDRLRDLPGYISTEYAIDQQTDKRASLQRMDDLNRDILPVIDENGRFVGIVERSRLVSSLIVDVVNKLEK